MKLSHYWSLLTNQTKYLNPAKLSFRNVYAVAQALFRKKKKEIAGIPEHMWEQIIWRRIMVEKKSPKCWREQICQVCGCDVPGKTMEDRACEGSCYPEMMSAEEWKAYKEFKEIKFFE